MKILHVEAGKHYYGGARQVAYIIEGLAARGVSNVLACPIGAEIADAVRGTAQVHQIAMGGDADIGMIWSGPILCICTVVAAPICGAALRRA